MKIALRILAVVFLLGAVGFWMAKGSHRGWTKNSIEHYTHDPVTELTGVTYENAFIPGVDFLAVCVLISAAMLSASFLFQPKRSNNRRRHRNQPRPSQP